MLGATERIRVGIGAVPCDRRPASDVAREVARAHLPLDRLVLVVGAVSKVVTRPTLALIALCIGTLATSNAMISPALCFPVFVFVMAAARLEAVPEPARPSDE